jgi:hypothetical protein
VYEYSWPGKSGGVVNQRSAPVCFVGVLSKKIVASSGRCAINSTTLDSSNFAWVGRRLMCRPYLVGGCWTEAGFAGGTRSLGWGSL